jgi:hypothetical protein
VRRSTNSRSVIQPDVPWIRFESIEDSSGRRGGDIKMCRGVMFGRSSAARR